MEFGPFQPLPRTRSRALQWQVLTADLIEGLQVDYDAGAINGEAEVRLERIPSPEGLWTMNGMLGGTPVGLYCPWAYGTDETHGTVEFELHLRDMGSRGPTSLNLRFFAGAPLTPGDYDVGTLPGQVALYAMDSESTRWEASSGTVTIVNITPTHAEGYYDATLSSGGTISGLFAVDILLHD